eukprot:42038-Rhodomonas_salina.2
MSLHALPGHLLFLLPATRSGCALFAPVCVSVWGGTCERGVAADLLREIVLALPVPALAHHTASARERGSEDRRRGQQGAARNRELSLIHI